MGRSSMAEGHRGRGGVASSQVKEPRSGSLDGPASGAACCPSTGFCRRAREDENSLARTEPGVRRMAPGARRRSLGPRRRSRGPRRRSCGPLKMTVDGDGHARRPVGTATNGWARGAWRRLLSADGKRGNEGILVALSVVCRRSKLGGVIVRVRASPDCVLHRASRP